MSSVSLDYANGKNKHEPNIITESEVVLLRGGKGGAFRTVCEHLSCISTSMASPDSAVFDELLSPDDCGLAERRGDVGLETKTNPSLSRSEAGLGLSTSISCRGSSRRRLPRTVPDDRRGECGDCSVAETLVGASSTRVASVSLEESVPPRSTSSSSSSLDVTSASFANSIVGVMEAV